MEDCGVFQPPKYNICTQLNSILIDALPISKRNGHWIAYVDIVFLKTYYQKWPIISQGIRFLMPTSFLIPQMSLIQYQYMSATTLIIVKTTHILMGQEKYGVAGNTH
ncbi:MAG: hypothetical protein A2X48_07135 [Lentisphaerae bacterium GWF2_49_21]|nr:MAG: hypothetical protein A2X48_07135 [Lentisphaerae bacterium GWF2_49_21]